MAQVARRRRDGKVVHEGYQRWQDLSRRSVMPAKAGIQRDATARAGMDSGLRRNDGRLSEAAVVASAAIEALSVTLPWAPAAADARWKR